MSESNGKDSLDVSQMRQIKETIDPLIRMMNQDELNEFGQFAMRVTDRYGLEHYGEGWRDKDDHN